MPNNNIYLKQARDMIQSLIDENPVNITVIEKAVMVNGKGDTVIDPNGTHVAKNIRCRISHEATGTFTISNIQGAYTSNLGRYILVNYKTTIQQNMTFNAIDDRWRIGKVDPLFKFGGITGYQAPLIQAVNKEVNT